MERSTPTLSRTTSSRSLSSRPSSNIRTPSGQRRGFLGGTPTPAEPKKRLSISRSNSKPALFPNIASLRFIAKISTASFYERMKLVLQKAPENREVNELQKLEPWFRKKSRLFATMDKGMFKFLVLE